MCCSAQHRAKGAHPDTMPALIRCLWLLLASACEAAPDSGPKSDNVLTPKSNNGPAERLDQKGLGDVPAFAFPPPPPLPPGVPGLPQMPTIDYNDPNFTRPEPSTLCEPAEIAHSNRTGVNKCMDRLSSYPAEGTECFYECEPGYIPLGRHICQWHDLDWIMNNSVHTDPQHDFRGWVSQKNPKYKFLACSK